jgi:hypothetical protein
VIVDAAGQAASTRYRTLQTRGGHALVLAQPLSGRTHQIRVHLATRGAAILGDATYAPESEAPGAGAARTLLHAWRLEVSSPGSGAAFAVEAPIPEDFAGAVAGLALADGLVRAGAAAHAVVSSQDSSGSVPPGTRHVDVIAR